MLIILLNTRSWTQFDVAELKDYYGRRRMPQYDPYLMTAEHSLDLSVTVMADGHNFESSDDNAFNLFDNRPSSEICSFPTPVNEWNTSEIKKNLKLSRT